MSDRGDCLLAEYAGVGREGLGLREQEGMEVHGGGGAQAVGSFGKMKHDAAESVQTVAGSSGAFYDMKQTSVMSIFSQSVLMQIIHLPL